MPCAVEDCDKPLRPYSDYCSGHHHRVRRYGSPTGRPPHTVPPGATEKQCTGCKTIKPLSEFGPLKTGQLGLQPRCRKCMAEKARRERERWNADPRRREQYLDMHRRAAVKGAYGPDGIAAYERIQRGEPCDVCGHRLEGKRGMAIDHCHDSGRVRGILCKDCNLVLGWMNDDPARLRALADYLERGA